MPRFEPERFARNLGLLQAYAAIAHSVGCTPAQLALAWLLHQGEHVIPIPGTTSPAHVQENADSVNVRLDAATLAELDALINQQTVDGARYNAQSASEVDTEEFQA